MYVEIINMCISAEIYNCMYLCVFFYLYMMKCIDVYLYTSLYVILYSCIFNFSAEFVIHFLAIQSF